VADDGRVGAVGCVEGVEEGRGGGSWGGDEEAAGGLGVGEERVVRMGGEVGWLGTARRARALSGWSDERRPRLAQRVAPGRAGRESRWRVPEVLEDWSISMR
jgi:hypothetical protein